MGGKGSLEVVSEGRVELRQRGAGVEARARVDG